MNVNADDKLTIESIGFDSLSDLLFMVDFKDDAPEVKEYVVEVPGGDSVIDLTEALTGDVAYNRGKHTFTFAYTQHVDSEPDDVYNWDERLWHTVKTELKGRLHGRRFDYRISMDPLYTYTGRFKLSFSDTEFEKPYGIVTIEVDYEPYKLLKTITEFFNVSSGFVAHFASGRKKVQPTFEFSDDTIVVYEGTRYVLPKGTYTIDDIWFKQGLNQVTFVQAGLQSHITHGEMARYTHEQIRSTKPIWEWYKGIEKHYVSRIVLTGTSTPTTGVVTFTATDAEGNVYTQDLDLGDLEITAVGEDADTVTIYDGYAYVRKIIDEDGTVLKTVAEDTGEVSYQPLSYVLEFPVIFSNTSEIVSLTHSSSASVTYNVSNMNVELVMEAAAYSDYAVGGSLARTHAEMAQYNHAQLGLVNAGTQEVVDVEQESVCIQYEWRDL